MTDWQQNKQWSDRFLPEIKRILGEHLIAEPPVEEDMEHNSDLMTLRLDTVRVSCRVRKFEYLAPFGDEFTIRAGYANGAKTELTKIIEGWGDYLFYGFADEHEERLAQWILGDLRCFRIYHSRHLVQNGGALPGRLHQNTDNVTSFRVFKYNEIPGFIVACRMYTPGA